MQKTNQGASAQGEAPVEDNFTTDVKFVVGVGASAGGLEALRGFFSQLPLIEQTAFVVVQHLSPQHTSMLSELLGRDTRWKVKDAEEGESLHSGVVYITPPNRDIAIQEKRIRLREINDRVGPKPSVDSFFHSLSEDLGEQAFGVVLSGTGSDGSHGVRAIKAAGGLVLVQSPASAKYDGMPRSAINTGSADHILPPHALSQEVAELIRLQVEKQGQPRAQFQEDQDPYRDVLNALHRKVKVNFANYKQNTLRRRIQRRIDATRISNPQDYVNLLHENDDEVRALYQDILINVTSFFRNPEAYDHLRSELVKSLQEKTSGATFRAWVAGCATGEEAYSLAILINDLVNDLNLDLSVQVFATDIDDVAMAMARKGIYPETALQNVSLERIEKYFTRYDGTYQIRKFVREMVVFARHDLTCDPPFMKMDLISCRNVFIYFKQEMQNRIFRIFHYALNPGGVLFLGRSETIGNNQYYFQVVDQGAKLYRRTNHLPDASISFSSLSFDEPIIKETQSTAEKSQGILHTVVSALAPHCIIVGDSFYVEQAFGEAREYLTFPEGEVTQLVNRLLPEGLSEVVTGLLHRVKRKQEPISGHSVKTQKRGQEEVYVRPSVSPLVYEGRLHFVIRLEEVKPPEFRARSEASSENGTTVKELEEELKATRQHLQTVIEEQETSNEELQALNEELHSSNEELQATNEELETSNEELQSTNEELITLNEELNVKSAELLSLNDHLESIQNAIDNPLFVIAKDFTLVRFNRAAERILAFSDRDLGKDVHGLLRRVQMTEPIQVIEKALRTKDQAVDQLESEFHDYRIQADPIVGEKRKLEGAVVTLTENTEMLRAYQALRDKDNRLYAIINHTPALVSMKDAQGRYTLVNHRFCEVMGLSSPQEVVGKTDEDLFSAEVVHEMRLREFEVLRDRRAIKYEEKLPVNGDARYFLSSKFPLVDPQNTVHSVCTIALDITDRVTNEDQLNIFRQVISSSEEGIVIFDHRGDKDFNVSFSNTSFERMLGSGSGQVIGTQLGEILSRLSGRKVNSSFIENLYKRIVSTAKTRVEVSGKDDSVWYELRFSRIENESQDSTRILMLAIDITEAKSKEQTILTQREELIQAGKLTALGEMAAGIAHELNTPLNSIQGYADLLEQMVEAETLDDEAAKDVADSIHRTVENIASVITGLRSIARMDEQGDLRPFRLQDIVNESVQICNFHLRNKGVRLSLNIPDEPVYVAVRPFQIDQVLINLINNAVDAIKKLEDKWVKIEVVREESRAIVRVIDSGDGISPQLAEKVMTPFFTTKREGTGLGLSLSQSILREHSGALRLNSDGPNTCFEIVLPVDERPVQ